MEQKTTDFLVDCINPEAFDKTINQLGSVLIQDDDNYYVMRVFSDTGFIKFAIQNQGYGRIIKELDELI